MRFALEALTLTLSLSCTLFALQAAPSIPSRAASNVGPMIVGIPFHGKKFTIRMDEADTIGSVNACMERVHRKGGGTCQVAKGSIKPGRTMVLSRRYQDVNVTVAPE
jgi:hypothetical protein